MSLDDPALAPAIAHAEEVAKILRENVVQGKLEGDDRYSKYSMLDGWNVYANGFQSFAFMSIPNEAITIPSKCQTDRRL